MEYIDYETVMKTNGKMRRYNNALEWNVSDRLKDVIEHQKKTNGTYKDSPRIVSSEEQVIR